MPWVFFALSAACFAIAFRTFSLGLAAVCLLLALILLLAGALGLASARIQRRAQSTASMLGPEQAAMIRKRASAATAGSASTHAATPAPREEPRQDPVISSFDDSAGQRPAGTSDSTSDRSPH